jgi:TetR/AcrR family transcriptional regulator
MPKIITDEEIFQAVLEVVSEYGFAGATTRQMAEAANVSEVTLFRKYENKIQLVRKAMETIIAQTDFAEVAEYSGDVATDLLRVVQAYQDSAVKHGQFIFILLSEMPRQPELANLLNSPFEIFTRIGQLLARYQAEGVLREEHPMHTLAALLGPLIYTSMMQKAQLTMELPSLNLANHVTCFLEGRHNG